jgi:hypothetical protein
VAVDLDGDVPALHELLLLEASHELIEGGRALLHTVLCQCRPQVAATHLGAAEGAEHCELEVGDVR